MTIKDHLDYAEDELRRLWKEKRDIRARKRQAEAELQRNLHRTEEVISQIRRDRQELATKPQETSQPQQLATT